jgi:endo-1,4-beta-xylanase
MPYRRNFLKRAGYITLSALLTMAFLRRDKEKDDRSTNAAMANYISANAPSLRQLAAAKGKRYGAAISSEFLLKEKDYADLIAHQCSIVTPNGELKWNATEPQPGKFTFESADAIADFCQKHNIELHGHNLFWHMGKPDWVPYPPTLKMIERHITGVMGHYRNSPVLKSWDVANEIIADNENEADNATYGLRKGVKPELIRDLFKIAASVDNTKKFYLNDFGIEGATWKSEHFLKMVEYLKNNGVKIDGAGIQSHLWFSTAYGFDEKGFNSVLKRLNELEVKPLITELDIIIDTPLPDSIQKLDQMVADSYKRYLDLCFAAGVDTVITWGLTDRHTWIRDANWMPRKTYRDNPNLWKFLRPLPYDEKLQPKLARNAIARAFQEST